MKVSVGMLKLIENCLIMMIEGDVPCIDLSVYYTNKLGYVLNYLLIGPRFEVYIQCNS